MTEVMEKTWREQAKELGIKTGRRTKVDVLADIEAETIRRAADALLEKQHWCELCKKMHSDEFACQGGNTGITQLPESQTVIPNDDLAIEPVQIRVPWQIGDETPIEELYRRIEALENRVNELIEAISKSKKVKGI